MCRHCGRHVSTPRGGVRPACVYVENIGAVVESDEDWDEDSTNNLSHMFSPFCGVKTVASRCVKVINVPHFFSASVRSIGTLTLPPSVAIWENRRDTRQLPSSILTVTLLYPRDIAQPLRDILRLRKFHS